MAGLPWLRIYTDLPRDPRSLVLGRLLGDERAWTYVVAWRLWMAEHAAAGCIVGAHAEVTLEAAAGWRGAPGTLAAAARDAGLLRAGPARDGGGTALFDVDWEEDQGAHVAKFQRDAKKPRGNKRPARNAGGTSAGPAPIPRGESRELRVESREKETTASQAPSAPGAVDDLPDATAFALEAQGAPTPPAKKPRETPPGEVLYTRLEADREARCEKAGLPFVPSRWPYSRQNKELGPLAKLPEGHAEQVRFGDAWDAYCADPVALTREPPFSLDYFWRMRSRYEGRAVLQVVP